MIKKIFAIYDSKAKSFGDPFFQFHKGEVLRDFETLANDNKTKVGLYPTDFSLFELGDYDCTKGKFIIHDAPFCLATAIEFVKSTPIVPMDTDMSKIANVV